jgi:predicted DNA-binding protein (MmcQ/YjbR family)/GNAT superfamily N-acetyltransferase
MTRQELIDYCLTFPAAYEDYPFDDAPGPAAWAVMRHRANRRSFALIYERGGALRANLKCDPFEAGLLRQAFAGVTPAYHMNKEHWNTVAVGSDVPDAEVKRQVARSYDLIKPKARARARQGAGVRLRPLRDRDIDLVGRWLSAPHVARWFRHPDHWMSELRGRRGAFSFLRHFIAELDGAPIGFCQYYDTHFAQEHEVWHDEPRVSQEAGAVFGIDYLIGEPGCLGKGHGKEIVRLLCEKVRRLGAERVVADPEEGNVASARALEANGFARAGGHYAKRLAP